MLKKTVKQIYPSDKDTSVLSKSGGLDGIMELNVLVGVEAGLIKDTDAMLV